MPLDGSGQYRHNDEVAQFHSKAQGKPHPMQEQKGGGEHVEIHSHGDGSFHTMHKGEKVEHATHGEALMHAAKMHSEVGHKHFHAHHDGGVMHTHSMHEGGEPDHQEHDGEDTEGPKGHFAQFMGEEEKEPEHQSGEESGGDGLGGLY